MEQNVGNLPNLRQATQALETALKDHDYGETFSFDQLDNMAGLDVRKYRSVVESVKKSLLRHHGKLLVNLRGLGYQICQPGNFHVVSGSYRNKAGKCYRKAQSIIKVANYDLMSEEDRQKTIKEAGKVHWLVSANALASKEKKGRQIDYSRPPSEEAILKFLMDKQNHQPKEKE